MQRIVFRSLSQKSGGDILHEIAVIIGDLRLRRRIAQQRRTKRLQDFVEALMLLNPRKIACFQMREKRLKCVLVVIGEKSVAAAAKENDS